MDLNTTLRLAMATDRCLPHLFEGLHEPEEMCRRLFGPEVHGTDFSEVVGIVKGVRDKRGALRSLSDLVAQSDNDGLRGDGRLR